jgi:hypothetical protein
MSEIVLYVRLKEVSFARAIEIVVNILSLSKLLPNRTYPYACCTAFCFTSCVRIMIKYLFKQYT